MSSQPFFAVARAAVVLRGREPLPLRVWYPGVASGIDQPVAPQAVPAPALAFGHGYLASAALYSTMCGRLAERGIVVVAPETQTQLFPSHSGLADDLLRSLRWLAAGAPGVPALARAVDLERTAVGGHSMGGGCAVLAAARDRRIRTVATVAAARTRPSALDAAARLEVPTLFLAAERDRVTPVSRHQRPLFEAVRPGTPTQLRIIRGGTHAGFVDPVGLWGAARPRRGLLSRTVQLELAGDVLSGWLLGVVGGRRDVWSSLWDPESAARVGVDLETRSAPGGIASR